MKLSFIPVAILIFTASSVAQSVAPDFRGEFREGLNPAAISESAAAMSFLGSLKSLWRGNLIVRVNIDQSGNVTEVVSVAGPGDVCPSVTRSDIVHARKAGSDAAKLIRFHPAKIDSQPTASYGWVTFDPEKLPRVSEPKELTSASSDSTFRVTGAPDVSAATGESSKRTIGHSMSQAVSLPKPSYPAAARALRAQGPVEIRVLIETDGSVFSAVPVSGHPLLRTAARSAACEAKFTPVLLSGEPVMFYGSVKYNFTP